MKCEMRNAKCMAAGLLAGLFLLLVFSGCETVDLDAGPMAAMNAAIPNEQPGDYFIGRRMYKQDYKMWGWVREPGQPWKTAKLVMMNEQTKLAPDREAGKLGADNNYEYRLLGGFTGQLVYEPASDKFYPEFLLKGYEIKSPSPARIFSTKREEDPAVRILSPPL